MGSWLRSRLGWVSDFRKPGMVLGLLSLTALLAIAVMAESWEQKDWTQWSSGDCYHILWASPWTEGWDGRPVAQAVSSIVVRQASVRQAQFDQRYEKMNPQEKQEFDQMSAACLNPKLVDQVIVVRVRGAYNSNDPNESHYLVISNRKVPALLLPQKNAISPCPIPSWTFPSETDPPHDLVFPRVMDGKPVIQPGDKSFRIGFADVVSEYQFDLEKMIYKGKVDF